MQVIVFFIFNSFLINFSSNFLNQFNAKIWFLIQLCIRWLSLRVEILGNIIVFFAGLFAFYYADTIGAGYCYYLYSFHFFSINVENDKVYGTYSKILSWKKSFLEIEKVHSLKLWWLGYSLDFIFWISKAFLL